MGSDYRDARENGVLGYADSIGFHILGQIGRLDLSQDTFIKRTIAFRLPGNS